jgi:hypothetical protein
MIRVLGCPSAFAPSGHPALRAGTGSRPAQDTDDHQERRVDSRESVAYSKSQL